MWPPGGPKIISALASCSKGLNFEMAWGTKFEMRGNEKKRKKNSSLEDMSHVDVFTLNSNLLKGRNVYYGFESYFNRSSKC